MEACSYVNRLRMPSLCLAANPHAGFCWFNQGVKNQETPVRSQLGWDINNHMTELARPNHNHALEEVSAIIPDLFVHPLIARQNHEGEILKVLDGSHPLLRRFRSLEILRIEPKEATTMRMRLVADEVYALLEGQILCAWLDLREASSSYERYVQWTFRDPTLLLAPFGVALGLQALDVPALVIRIATHSLKEQEDLHPVPWSQKA